MKIFVVTGQTATGKTKMALELAKKNNGELINCDSRQIYKKLNIITGKDLENNSRFKVQNSKLSFDIGFYNNVTMKQCSHQSKIWLYDIVDPKQYFSSFDYQQCALFVIKQLLKQKKTPIIVGGTYLYLKHLLYEINTENIPPNWKLRKNLKNKSVTELQIILQSINNEAMKQLNNSDLNNPHRLIRKIEVFTANKTATTESIQLDQLKIGHKIDFPKLKIQCFGLKFKQKEKLKKAIENRVQKRLENGAIDEVQNLLDRGYLKTDPGLKTTGYQQLINYLKGKISKQEAVNQWINKEIQYAKRQYTFMKKDPNITWKQI